jgi:hypothetical protein
MFWSLKVSRKISFFSLQFNVTCLWNVQTTQTASLCGPEEHDWTDLSQVLSFSHDGTSVEQVISVAKLSTITGMGFRLAGSVNTLGFPMTNYNAEALRLFCICNHNWFCFAPLVYVYDFTSYYRSLSSEFVTRRMCEVIGDNHVVGLEPTATRTEPEAGESGEAATSGG